MYLNGQSWQKKYLRVQGWQKVPQGPMFEKGTKRTKVFKMFLKDQGGKSTLKSKVCKRYLKFQG